MPRLAALDTGPLTALFIPDDAHHQRAIQFLAGEKFTLFTSVPVIAEAMHLLDFHRDNQLRCLEWLRRSAVRIENLLPADWERIAALLSKYADLKPDFADLSLVALCDRLDVSQVATIDGNFHVYRRANRQAFENVFPID